MPERILQSYPILSGSGIVSQSILDIFVLQDILDYEDAEKLKSHFRTNREIEEFLVKNRLVTRDTINKAYSILLKIPYIGLANIAIPEEAKKIITKQIAHKYSVIPFNVDGQIIRIAVSKPSDLLMGFMKSLVKIFEARNLVIELFITGDSDFRETVKQYDNKKDDKILIKKGSLPVIYLRNLKIIPNHLTKIPREFIQRYRIIIFAENVYGGFMIACQEPDSFVTKKVLDYIQKENNIKLEVFAASKDDFDHILSHYDDYLKGINVSPEITNDKESLPQAVKSEEIKQDDRKSNFSLENLFKSEKKGKSSEIIIDSIMNDVQQREDPTQQSKTLPEIDLKNANVNPDLLKLLPTQMIKKYRVAIFSMDPDGTLHIASDTPEDENTDKTIKFLEEQHKVKVFKTSKESFEHIVSSF
jgi:hypothetical protein